MEVNNVKYRLQQCDVNMCSNFAHLETICHYANTNNISTTNLEANYKILFLFYTLQFLEQLKS